MVYIYGLFGSALFLESNACKIIYEIVTVITCFILNKLFQLRAMPAYGCNGNDMPIFFI